MNYPMRNQMARARGAIKKLRPVLAHMRKGFSLIVTPHGTGTTVTFDLPANVGVILLVLVSVFFAGIGFVGVTYTKMAMLAVSASRLRAENQSLRTENDKVKEIQAELARIEQLKQQIETWAGITEEKSDGPGSAGEQGPVTNLWPRRYTYGIMKPFYTGFASYPKGMMLPADGWISRGFIAEARGKAEHPGIDIVASKGTPVRCALDGVVKEARWDEVYGNFVVVEHGDSLSTIYGHNDKTLVKEGDHVTKGQIIATVGSTGKSTAPHVHFEILRNGKPVDPGVYMELTKS